MTLAAVLLAVAVVGMLAPRSGTWRRGHRKGAALLTAGALVTAAAVGWYAWNLNDKLGDITRVDDGVRNRASDRRRSRPRRSTSC